MTTLFKTKGGIVAGKVRDDADLDVAPASYLVKVRRLETAKDALQIERDMVVAGEVPSFLFNVALTSSYITAS